MSNITNDFNVAIIGAGSMGCAMAVHLGRQRNEASFRHNISLWSPMEDEIKMLMEHREHLQRLPGVKLPDNIEFCFNLKETVAGKNAVIMAVPSQKTRENCREIADLLCPDVLVTTCSKGIEEDTGKLLAEIIKEELPDNPVAVLSGPSHAEEIARKVPTAVVAASEDINTAEKVQDLFMSNTFRVYTNTDVTGVELGASLKNVIALCAGIADGLGYGDNTKAALMTRGMAEISRLGVAMGGKAATFFGLTGMGDLIVTCTSVHSRNRKAGVLIGQGMPIDDALKKINMVVEGYTTAKPAYMLGQKMDIDLPIINKAYEILFKGYDPKNAVMDLLERDKKGE